MVDFEPEYDPPKPQSAPFNPLVPGRLLTPRAAKITDEAADTPTLNMKATA